MVSLERLEFTNDEHIGDNWIIPVGTSERPLTFEYRAGKARKPQFHMEDRLTVRECTTEQGESGYALSFPNVLKSTHGTRAFCYSVKIETRSGGRVKTLAERLMFADKYAMGDKFSPRTAVITIKKEAVPAGSEVRFSVTPCNSFGGTGRPVRTGWTVPE